MRDKRWLKYRDELWIPFRKRTYLYWFKFLREAEECEDKGIVVDWSKYKGWGGSNYIMGVKNFDTFWEDKWKKLFSVKSEGSPISEQRFPLTTTAPKLDAIRIRLKVWMYRDTKPSNTPNSRQSFTSHKGTDHFKMDFKKRGGNKLDIARKVIQTETRKQTPLWGINPDDDNNDPEEVARYVSRYLRQARTTINNVCNGQFP